MKRPRRSRAPKAPSKPVRVLIVGGGCAGMAAAWHLSRQPGYEIHVFEKSWRLGGKGASVRAADGRILEHGLHVWLGYYENAFRMMRECYAEVERRDWGPGRTPAERLAHGRIDDAFFPESHIGVAHPDPQGDWKAWSGYFPPAKGLPGTELDERTNPFTLANYALRCFDLLKTLTLSVIGPPEEGRPGRVRPNERSTSDESADLNFSLGTTDSLIVVIERMVRLLRNSSLTGTAVLLQSVTILERWLQSLDDFSPQAANSTLRLMEAVAGQTRRLLQDFTKVDEDLRMKTEILDIVLTTLVGLFRHRVMFDERGLDAINDLDYRAWLLQNGATYSSLESPFLTGNYDFAFAYRDGARTQPRLAAGVALRGVLRMMFTYRGAMFWRIRSGMGDAVFAPLYKVLLASRPVNLGKGEPVDSSRVQFHFLHELEAVRFDAPSKGNRYVSSLKFRTIGDPSDLDRRSSNALDDCGCWPDQPASRFAEALQAETRTRDLTVGSDFDSVIFALGVDDFKKACIDAAEFQNDDAKLPPSWTAMGDHIETVATKSAQVWLNTDLHGLGWYRGSGIFSALGSSFEAWADMTHTLAAEQAWRDGMSKPAGNLGTARSVAYFCATLPKSVIDEVRLGLKKIVEQIVEPGAGDSDGGTSAVDALMIIAHGTPDRSWTEGRHKRMERDREQLVEYIRSANQVASSGTLDKHRRDKIETDLMRWTLDAKVAADLEPMLTKEMEPVWPEAFRGGSTAWQNAIDVHVQANFEGSDRYTLSLPGSLAYRISPLDRSVENMTIAGDWTACGLDTGCVEAAVMSGMLAAHAISGKPELEHIIGYDHP